MKFCSVCDNMYYMRVDDEKEEQLVYYCRNCGHQDDTTTDNICVLHTDFKKKEQKFHNFLNEYTKLDPTLPRLTNMNCPNPECPSNTEDKESEVIYIRYDDTHMKFVYLCSYCEQVWKTGEQS